MAYERSFSQHGKKRNAYLSPIANLDRIIILITRRVTVQKRILFFEVLILIACLLAGSCGRPPSSEASLSAASQLIRPEALRAHVEFLADDALEGRGTGSRGHDLAVKYLRAQFAALGLRGGAENGSYFQRVPLLRTEVQTAATSLVLGGMAQSRNLTYGTDFALIDTHASQEGEFSGPVVFVGFGISAAELNYDDYAGLDVKDKVVAFLSDAPVSFPATLRAYYSDNEVKRGNAAAHGAAGIIELRTPSEEKRFPWPFVLRELAIGWNSLRWREADGRPHGLGDRIQFWALLNRSGSEALCAGESHSLDELFQAAAGQAKLPVFPLEKTAAVRYRSLHTPVESMNVISQLEGSDAELRDEYVVLSSHVDHLGIGPEVAGDTIYNGALDSAAGCAVLVEVARAFKAAGVRPKRSIIFLAVTGEEEGLLGSDYFACHPTVPAGRILADINVDGGGAALFPIKDVVLYGHEHSSLGPMARQSATEAGLDVSPDPWPEEVYFIRQDAYPFIRKGVPALYVDTGVKSLDPKVDGLALLRRWNVTIYHSPKDDVQQDLDYESGARFSRFVFRLCHAVANGDERPKWNQGDFFGQKFRTPAQ